MRREAGPSGESPVAGTRPARGASSPRISSSSSEVQRDFTAHGLSPQQPGHARNSPDRWTNAGLSRLPRSVCASRRKLRLTGKPEFLAADGGTGGQTIHGFTALSYHSFL